MIDIHSHILPGIDDGAENRRVALDMARVALNGGTDVMIATPHCNIPGFADNYWNDELIGHYEAFCESLYRHNLELTLLLGAEVFGTRDVAYKISDGIIPTLHNTDYLLIEFDFGSEEREVKGILRDVAHTGVKPVVAHPERYPFIQSNPYIMEDLVARGYHLQVNKGSILGQFGRTARAAAEFALDKRMVSFVASDTHSVTKKSASMSEAADYVGHFFSKRYANEIFFENPRRLIEGEKVPHPNL